MLHVQNLELDRQSPLLFLTFVTVRSSKIHTTTFCLICLHLRKSWTWHLVYRIIMKVKLSMSSNLKWIEVKNHHSNSKATTTKKLSIMKTEQLISNTEDWKANYCSQSWDRKTNTENDILSELKPTLTKSFHGNRC